MTRLDPSLSYSFLLTHIFLQWLGRCILFEIHFQQKSFAKFALAHSAPKERRIYWYIKWTSMCLWINIIKPESHQSQESIIDHSVPREHLTHRRFRRTHIKLYLAVFIELIPRGLLSLSLTHCSKHKVQGRFNFFRIASPVKFALCCVSNSMSSAYSLIGAPSKAKIYLKYLTWTYRARRESIRRSTSSTDAPDWKKVNNVFTKSEVDSPVKLYFSVSRSLLVLVRIHKCNS